METSVTFEEYALIVKQLAGQKPEKAYIQDSEMFFVCNGSPHKVGVRGGGTDWVSEPGIAFEVFDKLWGEFRIATRGYYSGHEERDQAFADKLTEVLQHFLSYTRSNI